MKLKKLASYLLAGMSMRPRAEFKCRNAEVPRSNEVQNVLRFTTSKVFPAVTVLLTVMRAAGLYNYVSQGRCHGASSLP
jgi:hypothetical protein